MRDLETTARIRREDLTELLELERAPSKQRITARMPAVTLTNLLCLDETPAPAAMPVVTFRKSAVQPIATAWPLDRWPSVNRGFVIAMSATATLVLAHLLSLL